MEGLGQKLFQQAVPIALASIVLYTIYGVVYRLYLSPIAGFPGPKLAALTLWYEFYYDIFPNYGQYTFHIRDLHAKYGPIIRINPYELHISTPQFYETLYCSNKKRNKWSWLVQMYALDTASLSTIDHNKHRERRSALNPFFSTANVRKLQPLIEEKVNLFIERLRGLRDGGEVSRLVVMLSAFSNDVVMKYSFGRTYHRLENPNFDVNEYEAMHEGANMGFLTKHLHWILRMLKILPEFVLKRLDPGLAALVETKRSFRKQIIATVKETSPGVKELSHPTIFDELLNGELPPEERSVERLTDEAVTIVVAGSETVAWALTVGTYHILANLSILRNLKTELATAIPEPSKSTPQVTLENLPYLSAVIKESLRLSYGAASRLQRLAHEPLVFSSGTKDWTIPPFTPVSMTSVLIHHDESIFPSSQEFRPERWLENPRLDKYLVSFSKGSRQCLGMNLAYAEMYLWLANVFRRFGSKEVRFEDDEGVIELFETTKEDVEIWADRFNPVVRPGSQAVRIRVLE